MSAVDIHVPYYAARATEYDATSGYQRREAAAALAPVRARYQLAFAGKDVLEIACGTGYWTKAVALTARSVLATDVNSETIEVARQRVAGRANVRFQVANAYTLEGVAGPFTGAYGQYWWSHIPMARIREFLAALHARLVPGSRVMFLDALEYHYRRPRRFDENGDLLEERLLRDGTSFEIVKNFPSAEDVRSALAGLASEVTYREYAAVGYWFVSYIVNKP